MAIRLKKGFLVLLAILLLILSACGFRIEPSCYGKVIDAETRGPLKDVAVIVTIVGYCPGIGTGGDHKDIAIKETRTDEKGNYRFPWKFYGMPFYHFYDDTLFTYVKPGYFEKRESRSDRNDITKLFKMTHYLEFGYYRGHYLHFHDLEEKSEYYRDAIRQNRTIEIIPQGEKGVFEVFEGRAFGKIYSTVNKSNSVSYVRDSVSRSIYYAYDQIEKKWLTLDSRGKIVRLDISVLPEWYFLSSDMWGWSIFANRNLIFYTVRMNNTFQIKYINPVKGDISGLSGTVDNFFAIEDKGILLCHYLDRNIHKCYKVEDLPASGDTLDNDSQFRYVAHTTNFGYYAITRTHNYWHVYNFFGSYGGQSFVELGMFPSDREITAFAVEGGSLYIAFKNEGIRKYELGAPYYGKRSMKEDKNFLKNSMEAKYPDVCYLDVGSSVNAPGIYAVAGNDRIYRFSTEGIPDYKVRVEIE